MKSDAKMNTIIEDAIKLMSKSNAQIPTVDKDNVTSTTSKEAGNSQKPSPEQQQQQSPMTVREKLRYICGRYSNHDQASAQECVFNLLGLRLSQCSRESVFVPTFPPPERFSLMKPIMLLRLANMDDRMVFDNLLDHYQGRHERLSDLCLTEFATNYNYISKSKFLDLQAMRLSAKRRAKNFKRKLTDHFTSQLSCTGSSSSSNSSGKGPINNKRQRRTSADGRKLNLDTGRLLDELLGGGEKTDEEDAHNSQQSTQIDPNDSVDEEYERSRGSRPMFSDAQLEEMALDAEADRVYYPLYTYAWLWSAPSSQSLPVS